MTLRYYGLSAGTIMLISRIPDGAVMICVADRTLLDSGIRMGAGVRAP
jgi:hypothetical protein